jgi:ectoine hydroxylase-related dioxygenase (phytanoyl-CoA dioxygenase family)
MEIQRRPRSWVVLLLVSFGSRENDSHPDFYIPASKVTKENGATEIVLGSHVWNDQRKPAVEEVTYGEMDIGDSLLMLGNCYHGAGANVTANSFRSVVVTLFCKGVYRSEENQFLAVTAEHAMELPHDVQDLIGWRASAPFCGWHDLSHPYRLIRDVDNLNSDLF